MKYAHVSPLAAQARIAALDCVAANVNNKHISPKQEIQNKYRFFPFELVRDIRNKYRSGRSPTITAAAALGLSKPKDCLCEIKSMNLDVIFINDIPTKIASRQIGATRLAGFPRH